MGIQMETGAALRVWVLCRGFALKEKFIQCFTSSAKACSASLRKRGRGGLDVGVEERHRLAAPPLCPGSQAQAGNRLDATHSYQLFIVFCLHGIYL